MIREAGSTTDALAVFLPLLAGSRSVSGSQHLSLVWQSQDSPSSNDIHAWTGMLPDGSERAKRDVGECVAS